MTDLLSKSETDMDYSNLYIGYRVEYTVEIDGKTEKRYYEVTDFVAGIPIWSPGGCIKSDKTMQND